jgi:hypothetical protein
MTAQERYKLAQVVFSQVGANGDLYGELAKAMTLYDQMKDIKDKMAMAPPVTPPIDQNMQNLPPGSNETQDMGQNLGQGGELPMP